MNIRGTRLWLINVDGHAECLPPSLGVGASVYVLTEYVYSSVFSTIIPLPWREVQWTKVFNSNKGI